MSFRLAALLPLVFSMVLRAATPWNVARSPHFSVYSHRSDGEARAALAWFEQLRATVTAHFGLNLDDSRPVSVFGFNSAGEYEPYRLRATADAYYVAGDGQDYIVMPTVGSERFATAAHEYAHLVLHRAGAHLPPWLSEGLADVFSTIRIAHRGIQVGGEPFGRASALRGRAWLPLESLLSLPADSPLRGTRGGSDIFYAQSWALTEMLLFSPQYAPRFPQFVAALSKAPASGAEALAGTYAKPLAAIARDLEVWVSRRKSAPIVLAAAPPAAVPAIQSIQASDLSVQLMLAAMLLAAEDLDGAESIYRATALDAPEDPSVLAGLATVALAQGKPDESRKLFQQALSFGLTDAGLCYRYAALLDRTGGSVEERRAALQRAVASRAGFDDARYALALLEKNSGNDAAALAELRAMREVAPPRAYHYWFAVADALAALGRNDEAVSAAKKASEFASDAEERALVAQLAYQARTHLAVRFAFDASGHPQLVTTRVPNDATAWNPFIQPTDDIRRVEGTLREVDCAGPVVRMLVETGTGRITILIPDPSHVQMRNAPSEFVCGPQSPADIIVQCNREGIARGIEFR